MEAPPIFMASLKEQSQQIMGGGGDPFNALFAQIPSSDHSTTNPAAFMANYAQHIYSLNLPPIPSNEKQSQIPPPTSLAAFGQQQQHGGFGQTTVVKMEEVHQLGGNGEGGNGGGGFLLGGCQEDQGLEFNMGESEDEDDEDEEGDEGENIREDGGGTMDGGDDIGAAAAGEEGSPNGRQQQQLFVEFGGRKHGVVNSVVASSNGVDAPERRSIASFSDNDVVHLLAPLGHHSLSLAPQQQQPQSIHQPILPIPPTSSSSGQQPISVIVHPNGGNQQQQSQKPPTTTMEDHECGGWNDPIIVGGRGAPNSSSSSLSISIAGGPNSLLQNSHHHHHSHSMLIRDDFIFSQSAAQCASPPSTAIAGAGNDFLYDQPIGVANSLLEDSFLNSMPPNPLLNIPCSSSGASSLAGFLDLHQQQQQQQRHRRDGSVGISPCSSSTQISASSPDDSIFAPPNHPQHFLHNRQFSSDANCPQFPSALSLANAGGGINGQNEQQNFRIYQPKMQQTRQQIFGAHSVGDEGEMTMGEEEEGELGEEEANDAENEECRREAAMLMGGEEEDFDEAERDVKPTFRIIQCQTATTTTLGQIGGQQQFGNAGQFDEEDDFALSPPPPPLTPPSKTRSKMHDLALKHRLISNQNLRSQGVIYLSPEEKKTLVQEGFPIPTKLPLMREEEEALKIVRRKIKNKLSAQESRRKRKEYMDMLEKRVHAYFADNTALRQKIRQLEATNRYLMMQMHQKGGGGLQENDVKQK